MNVDEYPPQEPLSEAGQKYAGEVMRRGRGVEGAEFFYGDNPYQSIGLHVPARPNGTVLAFVHGGGWVSGYKEHMNFMAPAVLERDIIFASIGYRLAPAHVFPAGVDDVAAAVAWLYGNVAGYGGDPDRIFVGGHSAGGHYTALLAVRQDWQRTLDLPATVIRGCLPISGVYDFTEGSGLSQRPRFLGEAPNERPASPIHNIMTPRPFLIAHGTDDFPHLMVQAEAMERALRSAGGDVERIELAGRNHFSACYAGGEAKGPWVDRATDWMNRH